MIFLALNTDANKRRTNKSGGKNAASDYEELSTKLLKKYTGQKTRAFLLEKTKAAADAHHNLKSSQFGGIWKSAAEKTAENIAEEERKAAEEENGFPKGH